MRDPKVPRRDHREPTPGPTRPRPSCRGDHRTPEPRDAPTPVEAACGFRPSLLRHAARLRGLREVGLLGSLTAVLAVTAIFAWHDTVGPGRIGPAGPPSSPSIALRSERPSPSDSRSPIAPFPLPRRPSAWAVEHAPSLERSPSPSAEGVLPNVPAVPGSEVIATPLPTLADVPEPVLESTLAYLVGVVQRRRPDPPRTRRTPEAPDPTSAPNHPDEARPNLLVSDASGRAIVSQFYARGADGRPVVLLPDGSLGWPDGEIATDRPFRPLTIPQLRERLLEGPFEGFLAIERAPYLVLSNGSQEFAEDAADLLQGLHGVLSKFLIDSGLPVERPAFPLVAIIDRDEDAFRRRRPIDPQVRAYYETLSNRIILFERSEQDRRAPELAAVRQPQMIAHEGVHQILQNIGIQRRLSSWPPWLVEGLAEFFATGVSSSAKPGASGRLGEPGRARFGRINPFHMATLIDLRRPEPSPFDPLGIEASSRPLRARSGPGEPWISRLMRQTELSATDYALAWALTDDLARNDPAAFTAYLRELIDRPPLEPRSPEQHLDDFEAHVTIEPKQLARRVDRHLAVARYDQIPYYAVWFELENGSAPLRRGVFVSQSPTMISRWLQSQTRPDGGLMLWWATPYPSRNLARQAAEAWFLNPFR